MNTYVPSHTLHSNDPLELTQVSTEAGWNADYIQLEKGQFQSQISLLLLNDTHIWHEYYNRPIHLVGDAPRQTINLVLPVRYDGCGHLNGHPVSRHCIGLLDFHSGIDYVTPSPLEHFGLSVDATQLMQQIQKLGLTAEHGGFPQTGIYELPPAIHAQLIQQLVRVTNHLAYIEPPKAAAAALVHRVESELITAFCCALYTAEPQASENVLHPNAYKIAQRAREFMEDSLHEDIALGDICETTRIGVRTLQRAFRATFNISPMAYLKVRRLYQVHKQLKTASPTSTTVIDTAMQWGFWHMSHFSRDYKALFGEPPSMTLSRC